MDPINRSIDWSVDMVLPRPSFISSTFRHLAAPSRLPVRSFLPTFPNSSGCSLKTRYSHKPHPHTHRQQRNNPSTHPQPHLPGITGCLGGSSRRAALGAGDVGGLDDGDVRDGLNAAAGVGGGADVGAGDGGVGEGVGWEGGTGGGGGGDCEVGHFCG